MIGLKLQKQPNAGRKKLVIKKQKKYSTRGEFHKKNGAAYLVARKNGWLDSYDWFLQIKKSKFYWNKETCYNEALKYKSRTAFMHGTPRAYEVSRRQGWLNDYSWLSKPQNLNKIWNEDTCREESMKYSNRTSFAKGKPAAYNTARKNGWLDSYIWLK